MDAQQQALAAGWLDCLPVEAALPEVVREAALAGMIVGEPMLRDYVARHCPDLGPGEQAAVVTEGMALLEASRG